MHCKKPTLQDAYNYICDKDLSTIDDEFKFTLIHVSSTDNKIDTSACSDEIRGICCIPYSTYSLFNYRNLSYSIIVPMVVS